MMDQPKTILKETFGYQTFKPFQQELIEAVLHRRDTLVVLERTRSNYCTWPLRP